MKPTILIILQLVYLCQAGLIAERSPHWENLECEAGHKYLFSEVMMTWEDARVECELFGGWLVDINNLREHNCLLRHGNSLGFNTKFWTDGNFTDFLCFYVTFRFVAHDSESKGVWVHASTGEDLTWINPKWDCCSSSWEYVCHGSRDNNTSVFVLGVWDNKKSNGAWCDEPIILNVNNYICKDLISP